MNSQPATDKQIAFINTLIAQRMDTIERAANAEVSRMYPQSIKDQAIVAFKLWQRVQLPEDLSKQDASDLINYLQDIMAAYNLLDAVNGKYVSFEFGAVVNLLLASLKPELAAVVAEDVEQAVVEAPSFDAVKAFEALKTDLRAGEKSHKALQAFCEQIRQYAILTGSFPILYALRNAADEIFTFYADDEARGKYTNAPQGFETRFEQMDAALVEAEKAIAVREAEAVLFDAYIDAHPDEPEGD